MAFNLESNISSYKSHSSSSIFKRDHVTRVLYFSGCELQLIFFNIHLSNIHTTFESYTYKLTKISRRPLQGRLGLGDLIIFKWQNIYHFQWWWYLAISQSRISFFPLLLQNDYSLFGITTAGSKQNLFCVSDKQCIIKELWTVDFQLWLKFRSARWTDSDIINKLSMTNKGPFSARYSMKISSKPDDLN